MRLLIIITIFSCCLLTACSSTNDPVNKNCIDEHLNELQQQTRQQDAGSLILYKDKNSEDLYYLFYYAEDKGMLDKGSVTIVDEDCNEICQTSIMTHWTFCVDDLEMSDVEEVEVIWKQE